MNILIYKMVDKKSNEYRYAVDKKGEEQVFP